MPGRHALVIVLGAAVLVAGCGRDTEPEFPNPLLASVPADTPYLFASGEPMPEELVWRLRETFRPIVDDMRADMDASLSELEAKHPELARRLDAVTREVLKLAEEGGIASAGLSREDRFVLYGHGVMPVMRLTVSDAQAFREYVESVLSAAELQPPTAEHDGVEYWRGEFGTVFVAAGLDGGVFSVGVSRMQDQRSMLDHLFGKSAGESIAEAGTLSQVIAEYGFLEHGAGFVSSTRVAELLIGEGDGEPGLLHELEAMPDGITPECRAEVRSLIAKSPRMVFGYDALDDSRMSMRSVLELEPALAQEMAGWSAPVPGLGTSGDARAVFGYGLDFVKAGTSIQKWFRQAAEREFACALLNGVEWSRSAGQVNTAPLYMAGNPKGMVMRLEDLTINDLEAGDIDLKATVVMLFENARTLAAMARSFVPQLQELEIPEDGTPISVPIPEEARDTFDEPAWVAMTETVMGFAVGEGGDGGLRSIMTAEPAEPTPVMHVAFDAGWLYGRLAELMPTIAEQDAEMDEGTRAQLERSARMMKAYSEVFDRLSYRVDFTGQGVSFAQDVTLQ